jgi:hypothetical protein
MSPNLRIDQRLILDNKKLVNKSTPVFCVECILFSLAQIAYVNNTIFNLKKGGVNST